MEWNEIIGQKQFVSTLKDSISEGRIGHAQLFIGQEGSGVLPLALAYVREILGREKENSSSKVNDLQHLDVHFSFPVFTEKNNSLSQRLFEDWRKMILNNPYSSFEDWTELLDAQNKQLFISTDEIENVCSKLFLKSYEGGTRVLIVWRADKMNVSASNKFLKFLEEPPQNTLIILLAEKTDGILPTILSRCQILDINRIDFEDLSEEIHKRMNVDLEMAKSIAMQSQGDYNKALKLVNSQNLNEEFEDYFITWVRNAFMAKKKPEVLKDILFWARDIAQWNREKQKKFLEYASEIFRLALMQNYRAGDLVYDKLKKNNFNWEGFSKYIHGANIIEILEEISLSDLHLYRNANAKIVWTDMGIKLIRYIHKTA